MPYVDWSKRYACQKRWKRENRAKVRAQKRRARIKKKCLSKSLVVVLEDCCKKDTRLRRKLYQRNGKRMTKTLTVVLEDYRKKKLPTPPPKKKIKTKTDYYRRDYYQRNRERIRAQRKECRQKNLEKYRARERELRGDARIHEVPNAKKSGDVKTATSSTRDVANTVTPSPHAIVDFV